MTKLILILLFIMQHLGSVMVASCGQVTATVGTAYGQGRQHEIADTYSHDNFKALGYLA